MRIKLEFQFRLTAVNSLNNTRMDGNNNRSFPEDKPIQESSYIFQEQSEEISSMLVTITEFANQTCNNQEYLNESVSVESLPVTKTF